MREVTIFNSLTPGATVFAYHKLVVQINPQALCNAIYMKLISNAEVYKTIFGVKPGFKGTLLPVTTVPRVHLADRINTFLAGLGEAMFPKVRDLSIFTIGSGIALPTVFDNLVHLSVEAHVIDYHIGEAVTRDCPKLVSLAISFPCGTPIGTRRAVPMPPWAGPTDNGLPFLGAMDFLNALPPDRLTNFEMGIWSPVPLPRIIDDDDEEDNNAIPSNPYQREPIHLREVGLAYEPSRMLLRALARHTNIKSLGLMRMDPQAYIDLPLLDNLYESLEKLYIFLPDRIWGNQLRYYVPNFFKDDLVNWLKCLKKIRFLRWVSLDDRQCRGLGGNWTWAEVLCHGISRFWNRDGPQGLRGLEELHVVLGLSRTEVFLRIEDLISLETLHVEVEPQPHLSLWHPTKSASQMANHALALSIVRLPKIKDVSIIYREFYVGPLFFPWPCTGATLRRGVTSTAEYIRSFDSKAHAENRSLRKIYIKASASEQAIGLWKFLSYFPEVKDVILDVHHNFDPEFVYKWVRATNMTPREEVLAKIRLYLLKPAGGWKIPEGKASVIDEYAVVNTKAAQMSEAVKRMPDVRYSVRSIRFG
jgi:hypothetical protein